ncbi:hypothetical protein [Anaplasma phagocytophilum]|uniref:hypothetical protein n=1 Tax=Anaplasma phagocytophilum TaxID=948 RepID=UPI00200DEC60|nr:hypothetical protein [Anaplasma phagocytophilum]
MCVLYEELDGDVTQDMLLNPRVEILWRNNALRHLVVMMDIWGKIYGAYFNAVEQTDG